MTGTPAGWHPTPDRPGELRYWDGQQWTAHYAPMGHVGPSPGPPKKPNRVGQWVVLCLVGVFVVGCTALLATSEDEGGGDTSASDTSDRDPEDAPDPNDPDVVGDEIGAQVVCEDFVEDRLKAPSTAEFSDEEVEQIRGPVWQVDGAVDSENGFGAMIRNNYSCRVKFVGDDKWQLVRISGLTN